MEWAWQTKPGSAKTEDERVKILIEIFHDLGVDALDQLTPYHVEQMRARLKVRVVQVYDKALKKKAPKSFPRSHATINRYTQLLRGMFYRAADWGMFNGPNPVRKVKFYRESPEVKAFSQDDVEKVVATAREISAKPDPSSPAQRVLADLIELALNTGLRRREMFSLKWGDWRDGELHVLGKGNKRRAVPLNAQAQAALERQPRRTEYIFDIPNRRQPSVMRWTYAKIRKRSGVDFTLHRCRHTFATGLLAHGADIVTISEILGHSRTMTSLLYSHSSPERKKMAVALLDAQAQAGTKDGHRHTDAEGEKGKPLHPK